MKRANLFRTPLVRALPQPSSIAGRPVRELATAMIANFGVSDEALLNVITGRAQPGGKLPFELPCRWRLLLRSNPMYRTIRPTHFIRPATDFPTKATDQYTDKEG